MSAKKPAKVSVTCPQCGHVQQEPLAAYSTNCKKCGRYYRVQEVLNPAPKRSSRAKATKEVVCPHCGNTQQEPKAVVSTVCKRCRRNFGPEAQPKGRRAKKAKTVEAPKEVRRVSCFQCGTELDVPPAAQSTMCKRCSSFVDLRDYKINHSVTKNFKTKGRFVVEEKGFVFNTDSVVGEAVIKGKVHGKIVTETSLEIHSTADIKGSFQTPKLVIPAGQHFRWSEKLDIGGADIGGELAANLRTDGTIALRSTGRLFGDVDATNFVVESGAVIVGNAKIGRNAKREK